MNHNQSMLDILSANPERSRLDFLKINELIWASDLRVKDRWVHTLAVPKMISEDTFLHIKSFISSCFSLFNKVVKRFLTDAVYRSLFGFSPELNELIMLTDAERATIPMARVDFFLNEETGDIKLCEINTDGSSAMNEDRILGGFLQHNSAFMEYIKDKKHRFFELFDSWVSEFLSYYYAQTGKKEAPNVAIADFLDKATLNEFKQFEKAFKNREFAVEIVDIRQLRYQGSALYSPSGIKIDAVYRRAVTADIMERYEEVLPFIQAAKDKAVCLVGGFHTQIIHNKRFFQLLHHKATLSFCTEGEKAFIKAHVPETYGLSEVNIKTHRVIEDRESWIIKPVDSYGSKGVYAGVNCNDGEWEKPVMANTGNDYITQKFCHPYKTPNIDFAETTPQVRPYSNITGVFCYNEKPCGIYSRHAKGDIISSQYDERTVPTVVIHTN